ncbi:MAG: nicotinamide mononucleotide transporter [Clostridiales bacterium]|nr:nicotinamide mononucleotide transporter [Clostridiales bacterium]
MKKLFKDWTKFEILLLLTSIIVVLFSGIVTKSNLLTVVCSITGILCALTQAKGKVISQFIGLLLVVLYSVLSFQNRYYGEVLIYIFIMLPLFIGGIISWIKNVNKETDTVNKNDLKKVEWIVLTIIAAITFVGLYYLLKWFNTSQLFVSTLSMVTSLFATYLVARRSKYGFLFYMGNDIIMLILWGIPVVLGNLTLIPMMVNPIINFINDTYGWRSWSKREK